MKAINLFSRSLGYHQLRPLTRNQLNNSQRFVIKYRFSATSSNTDLGRLYRLCRKQNTVKAYRQLLEIQGSSQYHGQIRFHLGNLYFQANKYDLALTQYTKAIKLQPQQPLFFIKLAETLALQKQAQQALQVLQAGLKHNPASTQIVSKIIQFHIDMGHYIEAFKFLRQYHQKLSAVLPMITVREQDQKNIANLLLVYSQNIQCLESAQKIKDYFLQHEKTTEGKQFFEMTLNQADNFTSNFTLGALLFQIGKSLDAKPYLQKAIRFKQDHYLSYVYLATILLHEDRLLQSINLFERALELNPQQSIGLTTLGLIYLKLEQGYKAKDYFLQAVDRNPFDSIALSSLGALQIWEGQLEAGLSNLKKTLEIDPQNEIAKTHLTTAMLLLDQTEIQSKASFEDNKKKE